MNFKVLIVSLMLLVSFVGLASATTHIPAGIVSSYSMNTANETYVLDGNVDADGTALKVEADNVVFDGMGYTVTFSKKSDGTGVYATGRKNFIIKNVTITQTNTSVANPYSVNIINSVNATIKDVTATVTTGQSMYFSNTSLSRIENCSFTSTLANGIYLASVTKDNNFINTVGNSASGYGARIRTSNNNTFTNCTLSSSTNNGVWVGNTSLNNSFSLCNVTSSSGIGLYIENSNYTNVLNTNTSSTIWIGTYLLNSTYSQITNSNAKGGNYGLFITNNSNYTTVNGGEFKTTGVNASGLRCSYTSFIYVSNCSVQSGNGSLFQFGYITNTTCTDITTSVKGSFKVNYVNDSIFSNITVTSSPALPTTNQIMMIGDSITEGIFSDVLGGYAQYTESTLNSLSSSQYSITNQGVSGETALDGRNRFELELDTFHPEIVTILFGANDIGYGRAQDDIINDIMWMATTARDRGITTYILLPTPTLSGDLRQKRIWLGENLSAAAAAEGITTINAFDPLDSIPENGADDGFIQANHIGDQHPSDIGNRLLGPYVARNIFASTELVGIGTGITHTIDSSGYIRNSRDVNSSDIVTHTRIIPNTGNLVVNITLWETSGNFRKGWTESSEIHNVATRHLIGDFPTNTPIQILRDGVNYAVTTSNATGYIDWTYSGGYSNHTFEATVGSPVTLTVTSLNALKSSSEAATNITISAETQYTGAGALYNSVRDTISSGYTLASLIVLVIGAYALFRYMGYI